MQHKNMDHLSYVSTAFLYISVEDVFKNYTNISVGTF